MGKSIGKIFTSISDLFTKLYNIEIVRFVLAVLAIFVLFVIIWQAIVNRKKLLELAKNGLWDEDIYRRMLAALLWTLPIFVIGWLFGFFLLKEGSLSHTWLSAKLFGVKGKVFISTLKLIAHHLFLFVIWVVVLNHFRVNKLPLGYFWFFGYILVMSMVVGSASYMYPVNAKIKATTTLFLPGLGLSEMIAYLFFTISSAKLPAFEIPMVSESWKDSIRKLRPLWPLKLNRDEKEILFFWAFAFLAISIWTEMRLILYYTRNV